MAGLVYRNAREQTNFSLETIKPSESFDEKFVQDWTKIENAFSDPILRAKECAQEIQRLAIINLIEAYELFDKCQEKKAWRADVGICKISKEKVQRICDVGLDDARAALNYSPK